MYFTIFQKKETKNEAGEKEDNDLYKVECQDINGNLLLVAKV